MKYQTAPVQILTLGLVIILSSCATVHNLRLARHVDNATKSQVLTEHGLEAFARLIEKEKELDRIPEVRGWFESALYFDPVNEQARVMIETLDSYRERYALQELARARVLLSRANRRSADNEELLMALENARLALGSNEEVIALYRQNDELRKLTQKALIDQSKAKRAEASKAEGQKEREEALIEALLASEKAVRIDKRNLTAGMERMAARAAVSGLLRDWQTEITTQIDAREFQKALGLARRFTQLNARSLNSHANEEKGVMKSIYLAWANALNEEKKHSQALEMAQQAWEIDRDDRSQETLRRMASLAAENRREATTVAATRRPSSARQTAGPSTDDSEAQLRRIEAALAARRLSVAVRERATLERRNPQGAIKQRLDAFTRRINALGRELHAEGLEAYRREDFARAVDLFTQVKEWNPRYENVEEYLTRSREKRKIVEQFQ